MNTKPSFTNNWGNSFNWLLAVMAVALTLPGRAETLPAAIPFSEIGARATAGYQGEALGVTVSAEGAGLRCGFQKLEGHATPAGLWLQSAAPGGGKLRLVATGVGRQVLDCGSLQALGNAPTDVGGYTALGATGTVQVADQLVRFTRPGLTEEYSVSVDGVRQDFIIARPPPGVGNLVVELRLSGARAETAADGAWLRLDGSGRALAYSRLRAEDATGRELTAHLEVLSAERLAVRAADANATYPVRIDPTFSDADWVSLNPGLPGASDAVGHIAADDSGNVYVGGGFAFIGTIPAWKVVAKWDGSAWSALPPPMEGGVVGPLAVSGTNLYAGWSGVDTNGVDYAYVAKWDGNLWSNLDPFVNYWAAVSGLAVSGTGGLYVGGYFTNWGGVEANNIVYGGGGGSWGAVAWEMSTRQGYPGSVYTLAVSGTDLYVGGYFATVNGVPANNIAKHGPGGWSALGSGINNPIAALAVSGTDLYAGGDFTSAGGVPANYIAKWDGSSWSALGSGMNSYVYAVAVSGSDLYAGGIFTNAGGVPANHIAKWDGGGWSALGSGINNTVIGLAVSGTNLYAGGYFTTAGGVPANNIAKWDSSTWLALGSGMGGPVHALAVSGTDLYAGGEFYGAGGVTANHIVKWDGNAWSALSSGMNGTVRALAVSATNLYAGGDFTTAGGVTVNYIAKWNGNSWSTLGSGLGGVASYYGRVNALVVSGTDLYAGGYFTIAGGMAAKRIAKWNGSTWSALGSGMDGYDSHVDALAVMGTNLYAGGWFDKVGGSWISRIARWNGSAWLPLGSGVSSGVGALAVNGTDLYVGGDFTTAGGVPANYIAKWDGNAWSALGSGIGGLNYAGVYALAVRGSDLYAGGLFTTAGGMPANAIAKWDGSAWSPLGSGMSKGDSSGYLAAVGALAADGAGHLFVGGDFFFAGQTVSPWIAQANVGGAPTLLSSPLTQTAETGTTVDLAVSAAGDPPPSYQWCFNGTNLLGRTHCALVLTNMLYSQSGTYTVVISNGFGIVTSAPAVVNVIPAVERRPVPRLRLVGEAGSLLNVDYADALSAAPTWLPLDTVTLASTPQYWFDASEPLPAQRYYRAWQAGAPGILPSLCVLGLVPEITLTGNIGDSVRVDCINRFGPIDAWVTLDTVSLTDTSQLYLDTSALGQPERLYRLVPVP